MKYLKLMPLLIAAAFMMPRAHAATNDASPAGSRSSHAALWIGISVLLLGGSQRRNEPFKRLDE